MPKEPQCGGRLRSVYQLAGGGERAHPIMCPLNEQVRRVFGDENGAILFLAVRIVRAETALGDVDKPDRTRLIACSEEDLRSLFDRKAVHEETVDQPMHPKG